MKKNIQIFLFFIFSIGLFGNISAQKAVKFGHFNSADLIKKMPEGDSAQTQIQEFIQELQTEMESMHKEYQRLLADYQAKENQLSDLLKANKQQEIQGVTERIQTFQQSADLEIGKKREELMTVIYDKIKSVVAEVAKEGKYTYIIENQGVLWYAEDSEDVLPLILKKMNL